MAKALERNWFQGQRLSWQREEMAPPSVRMMLRKPGPGWARAVTLMLQGRHDRCRRRGKVPVAGEGGRFPQYLVLPLSPSRSRLCAADPSNAAFSKDSKISPSHFHVFYSLFSSVVDASNPEDKQFKIIWSQHLESHCQQFFLFKARSVPAQGPLLIGRTGLKPPLTP